MSVATKTERLLQRLDAIGKELSRRDGALALLGLGSVGLELDRLDPYSDLDFFVIVAEGYLDRYLHDLDWMEAVAPVAYQFMNTRDGYKLLFEDGIFCEFAIFERPVLDEIPFAPGRIVWKADGVDETIRLPKVSTSRAEPHSMEWNIGEALTNLYVGLSREARGERLSATRFIQQFAVDRLLEIVARLQAPAPGHADPFALERRVEQRYPDVARALPSFVQGYERNRESARAILVYLERLVPVSPAMRDAILKLCEPSVA